jgi:predicted transporter
MNRALPALIGVLVPAFAAAHPSVVAHEHPHGVSILPDLGAVLLAALLVGVGVFVLRQLRKE